MSEDKLPVVHRDELPEGWRWISLGDVAEVCAGDVPNESKHLLSAGNADLWLSQGGSVVIVVRSALLGRKVVVPTSVPHGIDPVYLAYWLTGPGVDAMMPYSMGAAIARIKTSDLCQCKLPLPPIAEQHRIITEIREGVGDLQESIDDANACLSLYFADSGEPDSESELLRQNWVRNL